MPRKSYLYIIALCLVVLGHATQPQRLAFYDVGNCRDTVASIHYNDNDYTPKGRKSWNTERYNKKIEDIASVIDDIEASLVILRGVENLQVLRDIQSTSKSEYSSLHRTLNYYDGLDFALLYHADKLSIISVESNGYYLMVLIEWSDGTTLDLHLTRNGNRVYTIESEEKSDLSIAAGGFSAKDLKRLKLDDAVRESEKQGQGEKREQHAWYFENRIGIHSPKHDYQLKPYITRRLLNANYTRPLPTFDEKDEYQGGISSSLPIVLNIYCKSE